MTTHATQPRNATLVPEDRRETFLPTLFSLPLLMIAENSVYSFMERLSPRDYGGGFWDFYELDGRPLFLAPTSRQRFRIEGAITEYHGEVSAEAAGIIATMFTFSHLSFRYNSDFLVRGYDRLYGYMAGHPEVSEILQAID